MGRQAEPERHHIAARHGVAVGHNPIPPRQPPTRESFHLGRARAAYIEGSIDVERFEVLAAHVLAGGYLSQDLEPRDLPDGRDEALKPATPTFGLR